MIQLALGIRVRLFYLCLLHVHPVSKVHAISCFKCLIMFGASTLLNNIDLYILDSFKIYQSRRISILHTC